MPIYSREEMKRILGVDCGSMDCDSFEDCEECRAQHLVNDGYVIVKKEDEDIVKIGAADVLRRILKNKFMSDAVKDAWRKWFKQEYGVEVEE